MLIKRLAPQKISVKYILSVRHSTVKLFFSRLRECLNDLRTYYISFNFVLIGSNLFIYGKKLHEHTCVIEHILTYIALICLQNLSVDNFLKKTTKTLQQFCNVGCRHL